MVGAGFSDKDTGLRVVVAEVVVGVVVVVVGMAVVGVVVLVVVVVEAVVAAAVGGRMALMVSASEASTVSRIVSSPPSSDRLPVTWWTV